MANIYDLFPEFYCYSERRKEKYIIALTQGKNRFCVLRNNCKIFDLCNFDYVIIAKRKTGQIVDCKFFLENIF